MTTSGGSETFYGNIRVFRGFTRLMEPSLYLRLPDDWTVGVADIVESTKAIAAKRYKAVNMAGAAVIAAVTNALGARGNGGVGRGRTRAHAAGRADRRRGHPRPRP